jgi:hypothetical protein
LHDLCHYCPGLSWGKNQEKQALVWSGDSFGCLKCSSV